jgi:hypothetical protein
VETRTDIERRLDALEQASRERRAELRAIAASLPEATSRRAVLRSLAADLRGVPGKPVIAKRIALKLLRLPSDAARGMRRRRIG